jgi:hypothetical protein
VVGGAIRRVAYRVGRWPDHRCWLRHHEQGSYSGNGGLPALPIDGKPLTYQFDGIYDGIQAMPIPGSPTPSGMGMPGGMARRKQVA